MFPWGHFEKRTKDYTLLGEKMQSILGHIDEGGCSCPCSAHSITG